MVTRKSGGSTIRVSGPAAGDLLRALTAPRPIEMDASMPNDDAYSLGKLAIEVARMTTPEGVGDEIDRGLVLVRRLREMGYAVLKVPVGNVERQK